MGIGYILVSVLLKKSLRGFVLSNNALVGIFHLHKSWKSRIYIAIINRSL